MTFSRIVEEYEKNHMNDWDTWLVFDKLFEKQGKQSLTGIFNVKNTEYKIVFKISKNFDYLIRHDSIIMESLRDISKYTVNACRYIGCIKCKTGNDDKNPFMIENCKYPIIKDVLLCEYVQCEYFQPMNSIQNTRNISNPRNISNNHMNINNHRNPRNISNNHNLHTGPTQNRLYDVIKTKNISHVYSLIRQALLMIQILQLEKRFVHYDLHSNNILYKKCDEDIVLLYVIDENSQYVVPTYGFCSVIIDFGFSYIEDIDDGPLYSTLGHTNHGFFCDRFNDVSDYKLLLTTTSREIKDHIYQEGVDQNGINQNINNLRHIVKKIYKPVDINFRNGWDNTHKLEKSVSDKIIDELNGYTKASHIFEKYGCYCIDILHSLVILPLEEQSYSNIKESYTAFIDEWVKIENEISSSYLKLYIFREMIDIVRYLRSMYIDISTRSNSIKMFHKSVSVIVDSVSEFCMLKNINYEKMLCSLIVFSRKLEGLTYKLMTESMQTKTKMYDSMFIRNIKDIYDVIDDIMIEYDSYVYTKNTKVLIIDNIDKKMSYFRIPDVYLDEIRDVNESRKDTNDNTKDNINKDVKNVNLGKYIYKIYINGRK
jgi:hypothetical protein